MKNKFKIGDKVVSQKFSKFWCIPCGPPYVVIGISPTGNLICTPYKLQNSRADETIIDYDDAEFYVEE